MGPIPTNKAIVPTIMKGITRLFSIAKLNELLPVLVFLIEYTIQKAIPMAKS